MFVRLGTWGKEHKISWHMKLLGRLGFTAVNSWQDHNDNKMRMLYGECVRTHDKDECM